MIQGAVEQQVTERGDLDWKEQLPNKNPKASEEFAKDVAAMVNGGGGMIVFGIAENRDTSAAERIVPVETWSDSTERKLRSWAYSLIQPPVHGLEFTSLGDDDNNARIVILEIPASQETPHFSMKDDALRAPRRYGAQTVPMSERDIEQAYRKRFEDRRNNARSLSDLLEQTMTGVNLGDRVWLVAAARPVNPRPTYAGRIERRDARDILSSLIATNPFIKHRSGLEDADPNPRPGYRKWRSVRSHNGQTLCIVDVHDDGSVSLAYPAVDADRIKGFESATDVHVMDAQQLPGHIVHLARATADQLDFAGDFEISIIFNPPGNEPILIRTFEPIVEVMLPRDQLTPIHKFQPITGVLAGSTPEDEALETVRELALDVMNQGGSATLGKKYLKETSL